MQPTQKFLDTVEKLKTSQFITVSVSAMVNDQITKRQLKKHCGEKGLTFKSQKTSITIQK